VVVNDAVSFGINANTVSRALTRAPNAPSVKEALDALNDARDGAESLAPLVDQGITVAFELATDDDDADSVDSNDDSENNGTCGTLLVINTVFSDIDIRVVTAGLDAVIERNTNAPRMIVCQSLFVEVFDTGGALLGTFTVPFSAVDVPAKETPLLDITYKQPPEPSLTAFIDYLSLEDQSLPTSLAP